jgi:hypothetical protein
VSLDTGPAGLRYSRPMSDEATEKALVDRLNDRLPRILELKERVDRGARMSDADIAFLKDMVEDAQRSQSFIVRHPDLHQLAGEVVSLYAQIMQKAMENESRGG